MVEVQNVKTQTGTIWNALDQNYTILQDDYYSIPELPVLWKSNAMQIYKRFFFSIEQILGTYDAVAQFLQAAGLFKAF